MRANVALLFGMAAMVTGGLAKSEDLPPIAFSEEEVAGICEVYQTGNRLDALRSMVEVKYGSLDHYYASYDRLRCPDGKRMYPIYYAIHLGPMQTHIRYELEALAELPEEARRQILDTCYIHRGYGSTILDMVDRDTRTMVGHKEAYTVEVPSADDPDYYLTLILNENAARPLELFNEYRDALITMGAVNFRELTPDQQARCSGS